MASVQNKAPLAKAESLNDLDNDYENNTNEDVTDSTIDGKGDMGEIYVSENARTENDIVYNIEYDVKPAAKIQDINTIYTTSDAAIHGAALSGDSPLVGELEHGCYGDSDFEALTELQNLVQQSLQEYNKTVRNWLSSKIKQGNGHAIKELDEMNIEQFQQNENVKEWAYERIQQALGDDEYIEDVYDDVINGCKIELNGPRDDKIDKVLKEVHILGIENAKSILSISLPMDATTKITDDKGTVVKTLDILEDADARKKQFDQIKNMFGGNDKKLLESMTFAKTKHVYTQKILKDCIQNFLQKASDPKSQLACVQATIILNGHGSPDGKIGLAQDEPMAFGEVIDIISKTLTELNDDTKSLNLPFGVMVFHGLCYSYKSDGLHPGNERIQVKYFTDTSNPKTTSAFTLYTKKGCPVRKVFTSGHTELENAAQDEYCEDIKHPIKAAVSRFVPTDEELIKEKVNQPENGQVKGDTIEQQNDQGDKLHEMGKGDAGHTTPETPYNEQLRETGQGDADCPTPEKPNNKIDSYGLEKLQNKKPRKGKKKHPDTATTKCAKCSLV